MKREKRGKPITAEELLAACAAAKQLGEQLGVSTADAIQIVGKWKERAGRKASKTEKGQS